MLWVFLSAFNNQQYSPLYSKEGIMGYQYSLSWNKFSIYYFSLNNSIKAML